MHRHFLCQIELIICLSLFTLLRTSSLVTLSSQVNFSILLHFTFQRLLIFCLCVNIHVSKFCSESLLGNIHPLPLMSVADIIISLQKTRSDENTSNTSLLIMSPQNLHIYTNNSSYSGLVLTCLTAVSESCVFYYGHHCNIQS